VDRARRRRFRTTFDEVPELYDRARVPYPDAVFDDLVALAGLAPGSRVLEIGCATGRATVPLAARRLHVLCIELGPQLAAFARRKLARLQHVQVVNAAFETWEPATDEPPFDAVTAFTAFHWVDETVRYAKSARLLRERGALAVVQTQQVLPADGDPFWAEMQADYDAVVPSEDNRPPPAPEEVGDLRAEIEASGLFTDVVVRRYLWRFAATADEHIATLETYSGHRMIEPETRRRLYDRLRARIDARPKRSVEVAFVATLNVAKKR
jgi:SAM-dependent methyltransferase